MKYFSTFLLIFMSLFWVVPSFSDDQFIQDLESVREIYLSATDGEKRAIRKAIKATKRLNQKYPKRALSAIYKGAALSLRGISISKRPLDRMRETEEGLNVLDRALRKFTRTDSHFIEEFEGRLVASFLFINLPDSVFHRLKEGSRIIEKMLAHPKFSQTPKGIQSAIYLAAATSAEKYDRQDDYQRYLNLSITANPEGDSAKEAQTLLKAIGD